MVCVGVRVIQDGAVCQKVRLRPAVGTYELGVRTVAVTDFDEAEGVGVALTLLDSFLPPSGGTAEGGNEYTTPGLP